MATLDGDFLSLPFVRRRMEVLLDELARLDDDHEVFAVAFRTFVVRAAYDALAADATRLAAVETLELERPVASRVELVLDDDLGPVTRRRREVLEL